jgi:hypothetical protein
MFKDIVQGKCIWLSFKIIVNGKYLMLTIILNLRTVNI